MIEKLTKKELIILVYVIQRNKKLKDVFEKDAEKTLKILLKLSKYNLIEIREIFQWIFNQNLNQNLNQNSDKNLSENLNEKLNENLNQNLNEKLNENLNEKSNQNLDENLNEKQIEIDVNTISRNVMDTSNEAPQSIPQSGASVSQYIYSEIQLDDKSFNLLKDLKYLNKKEKNNKKDIKNISEPFLLAVWFYNTLGINAKPTEIDMKHFKNLLKYYPMDIIKQGIKWRLDNDPEGYWHIHISPASIYRNFNNWIKEASFEKITFEEFLNRNPDIDYRQINDPLMRAEKFLQAFNLAKKNVLVVLSQEDYEKKKKALETLGKQIKKHLNGKEEE
ncbi:MAG: hypothetical protein QXF86_03160 [Candidatus Bilamarchaeaceae archaeon]